FSAGRADRHRNLCARKGASPRRSPGARGAREGDDGAPSAKENDRARRARDPQSARRAQAQAAARGTHPAARAGIALSGGGVNMKFRDCIEAGERLAEVLALYRHASPIVLAMSPSAIPVADVVADALAAPHDLLLARAIGPAEAVHPLGGVADPGVHVIKRALVRMLG